MHFQYVTVTSQTEIGLLESYMLAVGVEVPASGYTLDCST